MWCWVVSSFMIFAVFDPMPLTLCLNFIFIFIFAVKPDMSTLSFYIPYGKELKLWWLPALLTILYHISTAHAQKWLFVTFHSTFWHHLWIQRPKFSKREGFFIDWYVFSCVLTVLSSCMHRNGSIFYSNTTRDIKLFLHGVNLRTSSVRFFAPDKPKVRRVSISAIFDCNCN